LRLEDFFFRLDDFRDEDFRDEDFRDEVFRDEDFRLVDLRLEDFDLPELFLRLADFFLLDLLDLREGTLSPSLRASESPIAMACLRLFTFLPVLPLFSLPCLYSSITFFTFFCAFLPYLRAMGLLRFSGTCAYDRGFGAGIPSGGLTARRTGAARLISSAS
jgi:hypothetical protein